MSKENETDPEAEAQGRFNKEDLKVITQLIDKRVEAKVTEIFTGMARRQPRLAAKDWVHGAIRDTDEAIDDI